MTTFNPPIQERSDDELKDIAGSPPGRWQPMAVEQAGEELKKRGFTDEEIHTLKENYGAFLAKKKSERNANLAVNKMKSYKLLQMAGIFLLAPFMWIRKPGQGQHGLAGLLTEHFYLMFTQRLLLLISGIAAWATAVYFLLQLQTVKDIFHL